MQVFQQEINGLALDQWKWLRSAQVSARNTGKTKWMPSGGRGQEGTGKAGNTGSENKSPPQYFVPTKPGFAIRICAVLPPGRRTNQ